MCAAVVCAHLTAPRRRVSGPTSSVRVEDFMYDPCTAMPLGWPYCVVKDPVAPMCRHGLEFNAPTPQSIGVDCGVDVVLI